MAETLNCVSLLKKNKSKHLEYSRYLDKMQGLFANKKTSTKFDHVRHLCYTRTATTPDTGRGRG